MQLLQLSEETTGEKTLPRQSRSEAGTRRKRKSGTSSIPLPLKCSPFLKNLLLLIKPEQDLKLLCQISGMIKRTGFFCFFFFKSHDLDSKAGLCLLCDCRQVVYPLWASASSLRKWERPRRLHRIVREVKWEDVDASCKMLSTVQMWTAIIYCWER